MIYLENVSKTYATKHGSVEAVKNCTLHIPKGEICGIIGHSGAGKSTLIRLINRLETPDEGTVKVNGNVLSDIGKRQLLKARQKIGMIFQHFNLVNSVTVFDNIAAPLRNIGTGKAATEKKVTELLARVGLADKARAYPSQLSGGQKQRVAIARALSCDPDVLLCDEATSALDPGTTQSILELIKSISAELRLTVVIITHQMEVVKSICERVVVMDDGAIVEDGPILSVYTAPRAQITKHFIAQSERGNEPPALELEGALYRLTFVDELAKTPFIHDMMRRFDVVPNLLYGNIQWISGTPFGQLIVEMQGSKVESAVEYLVSSGVLVEKLTQDKAGGFLQIDGGKDEPISAD